MKLDPTLGRSDRIGSIVSGSVLALVGILGLIDHTAIRIVLILIGLAFVLGGGVGT